MHNWVGWRLWSCLCCWWGNSSYTLIDISSNPISEHIFNSWQPTHKLFLISWNFDTSVNRSSYFHGIPEHDSIVCLSLLNTICQIVLTNCYVGGYSCDSSISVLRLWASFNVLWSLSGILLLSLSGMVNFLITILLWWTANYLCWSWKYAILE